MFRFNLRDRVVLHWVGLAVIAIAGLYPQFALQAADVNCSYQDAALYDGWGWNSVTATSCPPVSTTTETEITQTDSLCDYSDAGNYSGWGWNASTGSSCPPLVENDDPNNAVVVGPSDCDYSNAAENDNWGWNAVTGKSCPPLDTQSVTESSSVGGVAATDGTIAICTSPELDPDGDGFGWENSSTCLVATADQGDEHPPSSTILPSCRSMATDPDGDGYGWENNRSCRIVSVTTDSTVVAPQGAVDTGTPVFRWPAVVGAEQYRIVVRDGGGSGYSYAIDAMDAGCQTGIGQCSAQPNLGYFDNTLSWHVESTVGGATGAQYGPVSFHTPLSLDLQPITSNPDACEAYPSVAYDKFVAINNIWNARSMYRSGWSQTIQVKQQHGSAATPTWQYDWLAESDGGIYDVKSYPEVIYGNKLGVHVSGDKSETGLPAKVSELEEFTVSFSFTDTGNAERNVALESFFHETCDITGPCDTYDNRAYEMMIWVVNPTVRTPGDLALTGVLIDNRMWNVYIKPRSNKNYIAFTAQSPFTTGVLHWNRFVEWTVNWTRDNAAQRQINSLSTNFCMGAIELGTEVWNGSGQFSLDRYSIVRE